MSKQDFINVFGIVEDILPNSQFRVRLSSGHLVLAIMSGKIKKNFIKITFGDEVELELSQYDLSKGRIIYKKSKNKNIE